MSSQKGARSKLADVLADIKNSRAEDQYDYNNHDTAPTPAKRRSTGVNYVALSGHTPRSSRSNNTANNSSTAQSTNNQDVKTTSTATTSAAPTIPKTRTYVLRLFDRPVDLAQFCGDETEEKSSDNTPLYPICRAWVHGHRMGQAQVQRSAVKPVTTATKQPLENKTINGSPSVSQQQELTSNELTTEVHSLPLPMSRADTIKRFKLTSGGGNEDDIDVRIPQSVRDFQSPNNVEETIDKSICSMESHECMELNKQRWKKVRKDWSDARRIHESRYSDSFKLLDEVFMSSQRGI